MRTARLPNGRTIAVGDHYTLRDGRRFRHLVLRAVGITRHGEPWLAGADADGRIRSGLASKVTRVQRERNDES